MTTQSSLRRDPQTIQAWLVGSGVSSLAAAVHLIREGNVPGPNIHIFDLRPDSGGEMTSFGDPERGYFLPFECHPHFHGECTENLLSLVPSARSSYWSLMDDIREFATAERTPPKEVALTRAMRLGKMRPEAVEVYTKNMHVGLKHRMELIVLALERERALGKKSIQEVFDQSFFRTGFWMLWSTTFAFQPWHSAVEFQRYLCKYLEYIQTINNVKRAYQTKYNLFESVVLPMTTYLKSEGVDFRFQVEVTDIELYPESDPTTVSEIKMIQDGDECLVTLDPEDICLVDLGYSRSGAVFGTNDSAPPYLSSDWQDLLITEWKLWQKLSKSMKFGNPENYLSRAVQSGVETFTTTLRGTEFMSLYEKVTRDPPGTGAMLSLTDSNWSLTISIPRQPLFSTQPEEVSVICGYALSPASEGNFVKKPMFQCSGEEIFSEVLSHLEFPVRSILPHSITIPCGLPLGTAPLLTRTEKDRPHVVPPDTTNIACLGQFAEVPEDTTLSMEYSVRTAQMAVYQLLGLQLTPPKVKRNVLYEVFNLLV
ncbi:67 kDa myosin-cross-reactive antigen family protein [Aspergillus heteromorphus CBS 117.55]|uniref:67 kDa myosin-cross-reactive antigen family protein n=1 Tax=Aspergillus heteromorphus CBS 117.55 TaxID=1448321 RepID=A0A317WR56_9EURO|nr:67 kDa myosin-cross-reactive antigen family protein [Aspergillus heteromorphus CBS 117.55]PWY88929.1 67 kDa myosin-cross-reactive antigen family protein [Aspergillus heteromorphus CBS 117.55]